MTLMNILAHNQTEYAASGEESNPKRLNDTPKSGNLEKLRLENIIWLCDEIPFLLPSSFAPFTFLHSIFLGLPRLNCVDVNSLKIKLDERK